MTKLFEQLERKFLELLLHQFVFTMYKYTDFSKYVSWEY